MTFSGEFEIHLTLSEHTPIHFPALEELATKGHWKLLHIVLDRGVSASQPMLTRLNVGTMDSAMREANTFTGLLRKAGFTVSRCKLEASPNNQDVPITDADSRRYPDCYFEHHVKTRIRDRLQMRTATTVAIKHQAHLSRNAFHVAVDQTETRFITQRCYQLGKTRSHEYLTALLGDLSNAGIEILKSQQEFVVFDSNIQLDHGWLSTEESQ